MTPSREPVSQPSDRSRTPSPDASDVLPMKRAVLYLRVSTVSQVHTDYDPEGISIPAQRVACQRKAEQMGVEIADEYVEPGKSATNIEKRPVFQEMLARIREQRDVDYVIVYKLSRLNRNRVDDAKVLMLLRRYQVSLVSATESIDDTPVGQLMHGILAAFNEFRSAEDGADIRYKMGQKAKNGGTLGKAPLGYENVPVKVDGYEVRSVALDEERAPLVKEAWELFATGDYTLERLTETMTDRGLTSRPTRARPAAPVTLSKFQQMLRDPYYKGVIVYQGAEYPGRHPALVSPEVFDKVQEVLDLRSGRGVRNRKHDHYLKGLLFCERCHKAGRESRMIYTIARGRNGDCWAYYLCRGRQQGVCDMPYLAVDLVEEGVLREYANLGLGEDFGSVIRKQLDQVIHDQQKITAELQASLTLKLQKLEHAEERLIDLVADGTLPSTKARTKLTQLKQERERLRAQVSEADSKLAVGIELTQLALSMLKDPQEAYRQAPDMGRRQLNQAFYERMYVDELGEVTEMTLTTFFRDFHMARQQVASRPRRKSLQTLTIDEWVALASTADLLADLAMAGGSSRKSLVGLGGIEPPTSALSVLRSNRLSYSPASPRRRRDYTTAPGVRPAPSAAAEPRITRRWRPGRPSPLRPHPVWPGHERSGPSRERRVSR